MPRFDIEFAVNGQTQTLTANAHYKIRAGSKNYWYAVITVDATLAGLDYMYATFSREPYQRNRGRAKKVPLERIADNASTVYECQIPWEVLTRKGSVFVGLFAGDMLVTNEVEIEVTEAAPTLGSEGHHTAPWYKPFVDALNGKQDKEAGKGLSANDYTNEDKAKVAGIPANPKYTDTTYTAGDGINISEDNIISLTGGGGSGYSPYIGINGHWYQWSESVGDYVDTGVSAQGAAGADGFSPTASVSKAGDTATITITDKNGTTTATVSDGADGQDGQDGTDGFSPTASVVKNNGVITIAITDKNGTTTATLNECDIAFVTTSNSYEQLQTLYYAGKRLVLSLSATQTNDRYIWLNEYTGSSFIFIERGGYGYIEHECLEFVGWQTTTYGLDSAPTQNSPKPVTSGGVYAALTAYRTASAQNAIDEAQDAAIAGKLSTSGTAYKSASIPMGQVDSSSTATAFTATIDGITALRDGVCMWLKNGVITSAEGFTININNLGAKPVYHNMGEATAVTTTFNINYTMLFIYNSTRVTGGCWDMVYGYNKDTTYTPVKLGFGYTTCSTAAATAAKTASLSSYALNTGGIVAVKFDNAVPANATLNINSKGAKAIYYKGAAITADVIKAGDTVTMIYSTYYHVVSIDRWGTDIASMQTTINNLVVADNVGY